MESRFCPNDRQLALRATLGTGWSSRGVDVSHRGSATRLSSAEEETILQVLQRNEELVQTEKRRIDRMIKHFERMKASAQLNNTLADNRAQACSICRMEFNRLGGNRSNHAVSCSLCGRIICSATCSIELITGRPRQHSASDRHSLGEFNDETIGPLRRVGRSVSETMDEPPLDNLRQKLPSRIGRFSRPSLNILSGRQRDLRRLSNLIRQFRLSSNASSNNKQIACKICSEAIQIWKRSGAWFYKRVPSHDRASSPPAVRQASSCPGRHHYDTFSDLLDSTPLVDSEHIDASWIQVKPRSQLFRPISLSPVNQRKFDHQDQQVNEQSPIGQQSTNEHNESAEDDVKDSVGGEYGDSKRPSLASLPPESPSTHDDLVIATNQPKRGTTDTSLTQQQRSVIQTPTTMTTRKLSKLTGASRLQRSIQKALDDQQLANESLKSTMTNPVDSTNLAIPQSSTSFARRPSSLVGADEESSHWPRLRSSTRPQCLNPVWNESLMFEPVDEKAIKSRSLSYLRPDKSKKTKRKTRIEKETLNPEYNQTFYYSMKSSEATTRTLEVTVWDFDLGPTNDFIGGLTLGARAKAERRELWLAVFRPPFRRIEAWFQLSKRNYHNAINNTPGICD